MCLNQIELLFIIIVTSSAPVSSQMITTNVSDGVAVCPGEAVTLTCTTRNSVILIWTSNEYIGDQIRFTLASRLNETVTDSTYNRTTAALISDTDDEGGVRVFVSQLHIIVSPVSLNPIITCRDGSNDRSNTTTFQVLGIVSVVYVSYRHARQIYIR